MLMSNFNIEKAGYKVFITGEQQTDQLNELKELMKDKVCAFAGSDGGHRRGFGNQNGVDAVGNGERPDGHSQFDYSGVPDSGSGSPYERL